MLKIGVVGCGLQAATIAGYMGVYNDDYEVSVVVDIDFENARSRMAQKQVRIAEDCRFYHTLSCTNQAVAFSHRHNHPLQHRYPNQ